MRLIDADNIEFSCQYEDECTADKETCKKCDDYVCNFREVQSLQTAYDVDKVVEQLETARDGYSTAQLMTATNDELVKRFIAKEKAMNLAIKIVKAGGIE